MYIDQLLFLSTPTSRRRGEVERMEKKERGGLWEVGERKERRWAVPPPEGLFEFLGFLGSGLLARALGSLTILLYLSNIYQTFYQTDI